MIDSAFGAHRTIFGKGFRVMELDWGVGGGLGREKRLQ